MNTCSVIWHFGEQLWRVKEKFIKRPRIGMNTILVFVFHVWILLKTVAFQSKKSILLHGTFCYLFCLMDFYGYLVQLITEEQKKVVITDRMWARLLSSTNQPSFLDPETIKRLKASQEQLCNMQSGHNEADGRCPSDSSISWNFVFFLDYPVQMYHLLHCCSEYSYFSMWLELLKRVSLHISAR